MKRLLKVIFIKVPVVLVLFSLCQVLILKWLPVTLTPLMIKRHVQYLSDENFRTEKQWVSLDKISGNMIKAVVAGEDNLFFEHNGFDFDEIRKMMDEHKRTGKPIRGCSTISQQTAKNCFTWCTDTWLRKGIEAYYTCLIELIWGKKRIMEVYLNIVELGKGIYGVQAASEHYYGISAEKLRLTDAVRLTVCLPNPLRRTPDSVNRYHRSRVNKLMDLVPKLAYPDWVK